jgi:hypothetical protein
MRADVMEDARDRSAHTVIEPLGGVGMGGTTCIFAFGVPDRVVGGEGPTDRKDFHSSLIRWAERSTVSLGTRLASRPDRSPTARAPRPSWRTALKLLWPLNNGENRRLRGPRLSLAAATQSGAIGVSARAPANVELVDLDGAAELLLTDHQQSRGMIHTPGCWLADPDRLGQAHGRYSLVGSQDEPQAGRPDPQGQLRQMQRRPRRPVN